MITPVPPYSIGFQAVLGTDLSSRAIAWYGNAYGGFSHIDCILPEGLVGARSDTIKVDEPDGSVRFIPPGVQLRPFEYEKWERRAVMTIAVTEDEQKRCRDWIGTQIGRQYDEGAIWDFVFGRRDLHKAGRWICSAFATQVLKKWGRLKCTPFPDAQITPNGFCLIATALGFSYHERSC